MRKAVLLVVVFLSACAVQSAKVPPQVSTIPKATCSKTDAAELVRLQPVPGALYRDRDDAAHIRVKIESDAQLDALILRTEGPSVNDKIAATNYSALAYQFALRGDCERMENYYQRALASNGDPARVAWSQGWSEFATTDYVGAVNIWSKSVPQPNGRPFWLPYSLAVAFQGAGEHELALDWWRAAVASNPALATKEGALKYFGYWRENEKTLLRQLFEQS